MITAVASLLEAPDAPFSCSGSIFFIYRRAPLVRHASRFGDEDVAHRNMFLASRAVHDACVCEDNRTKKFFSSVEQAIT